MKREDHPVWTVYDRLRSTRLSVKYFGTRLYMFERRNFTLELILLASAPSSAIAGLWFWKNQSGQLVWQWLGIIAAIAAIMKPLLGYTKRIKEYEGILAAYRTLEYDLFEIKSAVEQKRKYDGALQAELKKAIQRERALVSRHPESKESMSTKRNCELEVRRELPADAFYVPEE
jgi:hypothetical protein